MEVKNKILSLLKKTFTQKNKVIILIAILFSILLIYVGLNNKENNLNNKNETENYAQYLENKLEDSLSKISNIGDLDITVTLETGFEYVYATEEEVKSTATGTLTTTSLVLVSGEPIIIKEIYPKIQGIVVIASGSENISVRMQILEAVKTALNLENEKITILK